MYNKIIVNRLKSKRQNATHGECVKWKQMCAKYQPKDIEIDSKKTEA